MTDKLKTSSLKKKKDKLKEKLKSKTNESNELSIEKKLSISSKKSSLRNLVYELTPQKTGNIIDFSPVSPASAFIPRVLQVDPENELSIDRLKSIQKGLVHELKMSELRHLEEEKKVRDLKHKLETADERYMKLEDEYILYKEMVKIKMDRVLALEESILSKNSEIDKLTDNVHNARMDVQREMMDIVLTARQQLAEKTMQFENLQGENAALQKENTQLKEIKQSQEDEISKLKESLATALSNIESLNKDNERLKEETRAAVDKKEEMQANYFLVDRQISILLQENRRLDSEKESLTKQIVDLKQKSESIDQNILSNNEFENQFGNSWGYDTSEVW